MMKKPNCPVIAIEEHYWDPELAKHFTGPEAGRGNETDQRLFDLGSLRLKEMDEAGIDVQVLSHGAPSTQKLGADIAADLTRQVNDRLAKVCAANPKRFAAFAALPTVAPRLRPTSSNAPSPSSASRARCCTACRTASFST